MTDATTTESTATDQPATTGEPTLETVCEQLDHLTERVDELEAEVEQKDNRIEELEAQLTEYKRFAGSQFADVRGRITAVEEQAQELEATSAEMVSENDDGASRTTEAETPLERICALPEQIADRELTTNQDRARFIARDVRDYAEKAPAGLVIDSRAIKRVLTAAEGSKPHTQTVARVMNFLDELGKEDVQQKKRRGKKLIVVDPDAADRYGAHHDSCDRVEGITSSPDVIAGP